MPVEIQRFEVVDDLPSTSSSPPATSQGASSRGPADLTDQIRKWHHDAAVRHDRMRAD